jgi:hypothetical protein
MFCYILFHLAKSEIKVVNPTIPKFALPQDVAMFACTVAPVLDTIQNPSYHIGAAECRDLRMTTLKAFLIACHSYITCTFKSYSERNPLSRSLHEMFLVMGMCTATYMVASLQ